MNQIETNTREYKLALELAEILDDVKSLSLHISFAKRYSESFLREQLANVLSTPKEKIKRSRAAYFTYLVTQHGNSQKHYHGH